jgi:hypothetical protein
MGHVPDFCRNQTLIINETSYERLSECWTEKRLADFLRICLPLMILPISLLSNCLSFLALRSRHMRGTSTAFFMLVLSVLDPLVLITKNLVYFPTFINPNAISCKILYFLIYVLGYTNVWILVIMTADKFLAVWFPLKVSYFCTITRAKYVCLLLLLLTSIISFHHFWTIDSLTHPQNLEQRYCSYDMIHYGFIQHIWRYIDFIIWCFLPFILILSLSVLIIYKLRTNSQQNIQQRRSTNNKSDEGLIIENETRLSKQKLTNQGIQMRSNQKTNVIRSRHRHITLMLLAISAVFLLLTLPNSIYFVLEITYNFNHPPTDNNYSHWLRYRRLTILTVIMFQLSDLQHATNFFLYLLTSDKFRRSILGIFQSMIRILPVFVTRGCDRINRDSNLALDQNRYGISCHSSVSDIIRNSHYKSNQRQDRFKLSYQYHSIPSRSATTITD